MNNSKFVSGKVIITVAKYPIYRMKLTTRNIIFHLQEIKDKGTVCCPFVGGKESLVS